jgi:large conductance mechanosensitive channel
MGILKEFKEFALRGNVVDMAVGIIIGAAFGGIVTSLVNDVMMPPMGLAMGGVDFSDKKVVLKEKVPESVDENNEKVKEKPEVALSYGKFINATMHFVIVAFCVFLLVKGINTLRRSMEKQGEPPAPTQKDCPHCFSSINIKATRCPQCTSELAMAAATKT